MNRTLMITGASSGIGAACAIRAAASGTHLLLHYGANREGVEEVADTARIAGAEVTLIQADVGNSGDITRLGREAAEASDPSLPLHLINNAGVVDQTATIADMTPDRLHRMFGINTIGAILVAREAVALMRRGQGGGGIVNVSSTAARKGMGGQYIDYAASKGAIDTFTIGLKRRHGDTRRCGQTVAVGFGNEPAQHVPAVLAGEELSPRKEDVTAPIMLGFVANGQGGKFQPDRRFGGCGFVPGHLCLAALGKFGGDICETGHQELQRYLTRLSPPFRAEKRRGRGE